MPFTTYLDLRHVLSIIFHEINLKEVSVHFLIEVKGRLMLYGEEVSNTNEQGELTKSEYEGLKPKIIHNFLCHTEILIHRRTVAEESLVYGCWI